MECIDMGTLPEWIIAASAAATAFFAWTASRSQTNVERFIGAIESHSDLKAKLACKANGIRMLWWEKDKVPYPRLAGKHGEPVEIGPVYFGIPFRERE
jgi:hypothetical protein